MPNTLPGEITGRKTLSCPEVITTAQFKRKQSHGKRGLSLSGGRKQEARVKIGDIPVPFRKQEAGNRMEKRLLVSKHLALASCFLHPAS